MQPCRYSSESCSEALSCRRDDAADNSLRPLARKLRGLLGEGIVQLWYRQSAWKLPQILYSKGYICRLLQRCSMREKIPIVDEGGQPPVGSLVGNSKEFLA